MQRRGHRNSHRLVIIQRFGRENTTSKQASRAPVDGKATGSKGHACFRRLEYRRSQHAIPLFPRLARLRLTTSQPSSTSQGTPALAWPWIPGAAGEAPRCHCSQHTLVKAHATSQNLEQGCLSVMPRAMGRTAMSAVPLWMALDRQAVGTSVVSEQLDWSEGVRCYSGPDCIKCPLSTAG